MNNITSTNTETLYYSQKLYLRWYFPQLGNVLFDFWSSSYLLRLCYRLSPNMNGLKLCFDLILLGIIHQCLASEDVSVLSKDTLQGEFGIIESVGMVSFFYSNIKLNSLLLNNLLQEKDTFHFSIDFKKCPKCINTYPL